MATVHRLKVTLRSVKPPIWRRIEVASDVALAELSDLLEGAMGWLGGHLHAFEADGVTYERPDPDGGSFRRSRDEAEHRLGDVLSEVGAKMRWDYDFGDGWQHDVVVEAIEAGTIGAGALDTDQADLTEAGQPRNQAAIAARRGLEGLDTEDAAVGVNRGSDVELEVGVDTASDGDRGVLYDGHCHPFHVEGVRVGTTPAGTAASLRGLLAQPSNNSRCPTGGCRSRTRPTSQFEDSKRQPVSESDQVGNDAEPTQPAQR
jgi:hypothetical protein